MRYRKKYTAPPSCHLVVAEVFALLGVCETDTDDIPAMCKRFLKREVANKRNFIQDQIDRLRAELGDRALTDIIGDTHAG